MDNDKIVIATADTLYNESNNENGYYWTIRLNHKVSTLTAEQLSEFKHFRIVNGRIRVDERYGTLEEIVKDLQSVLAFEPARTCWLVIASQIEEEAYHPQVFHSVAILVTATNCILQDVKYATYVTDIDRLCEPSKPSHGDIDGKELSVGSVVSYENASDDFLPFSQVVGLNSCDDTAMLSCGEERANYINNLTDHEETVNLGLQRADNGVWVGEDPSRHGDERLLGNWSNSSELDSGKPNKEGIEADD